MTDFIFLGSKIIVDGDCNHEIKRHLLLGRKIMTNLDIKKQRNHFAYKGPSSQIHGFSSSHEQMWALDHKQGWAPKNWWLELWCWRRLLRVPWTARRSNRSILKEINLEYSLEVLMLKLKLQYFDHLMWRADSLEKTLIFQWQEEEKGTTKDEMVGWHHWLSGHEFEQTLGDSEGQERLVCCSPWDCKESDTT